MKYLAKSLGNLTGAYDRERTHREGVEQSRIARKDAKERKARLAGLLAALYGKLLRISGCSLQVFDTRWATVWGLQGPSANRAAQFRVLTVKDPQYLAQSNSLGTPCLGNFVPLPWGR